MDYPQNISVKILVQKTDSSLFDEQSVAVILEHLVNRKILNLRRYPALSRLRGPSRPLRINIGQPRGAGVTPLRQDVPNPADDPGEFCFQHPRFLLCSSSHLSPPSGGILGCSAATTVFDSQ